MQLKQARKDTISTRQRITTLKQTAFRQTSENWNVNKRPVCPLTDKISIHHIDNHEIIHPASPNVYANVSNGHLNNQSKVNTETSIDFSLSNDKITSKLS